MLGVQRHDRGRVRVRGGGVVPHIPQRIQFVPHFDRTHDGGGNGGRQWLKHRFLGQRLTGVNALDNGSES